MNKLWREESKRRKQGVNKPGKRNVLSAESKECERKEKEHAERVEREHEEPKKMECKEKECREQERQEKQERRDRERKDRHHRQREGDRTDRSVNWFFFFYFWGACPKCPPGGNGVAPTPNLQWSDFVVCSSFAPTVADSLSLIQ